MIIHDFSAKTATAIVTQFYSLEVSTCKPLVGDIDKNYFIQTSAGTSYILKIASPTSSLEHLKMENAVMQYLANKKLGIETPIVVSNHKNESITILKDTDNQSCYIRLLTWVEGRMWSSVHPITDAILKTMGQVCGRVAKGLEGFEHQGAHRTNFRWDNTNLDWVKTHLQYVETTEQKELVQYFMDLFESDILPILDTLPKGVIQNDFNDNNLVLSTDLAHPKVVGLIDFGDSMYAPKICELAILLAYAMMNTPDPMASAREVIMGYHAVYPLKEQEIEVLFSLIANRLIISVVNSSYNKIIEPDNEYLTISAAPAWDLLKKIKTIHPRLAHYHFRMACGIEAVPKNKIVTKFLKENQANFASIVDEKLLQDGYKILDLGVGSLDLGNNSEYENPERFHQNISRQLVEDKVDVGIGKYNEIRPIYTTDNYLVEGNNGAQWRTVHIGLDVFAKAGTPLYAPLVGTVHSFQNNAIELDYGPTIILKHHIPNTNEFFYTLYGHLDLECLENLEIGQKIEKGQEIARIGNMPINGNWSPHLHFQIILDMLDKEGNFNGVAFPTERNLWTSLCPDPNLILGLDIQEENHISSSTILNTRKKHLGRSLSLSYQEPLHMVRAYKQYLYTSDGRRYLDTVNNVPHVGHQHPRVVKAAQRQMAVLNTNTRYLHENITQFAEELCATLPDELSVCHFVNSGSEANELAIRMARVYSGQRDLLVSEVGYHGNTNACVDVSSYKFDGKGGQGAPDWVHVFPIPDAYRGIYRGKDAGHQYALEVKNHIDRLETEGKGIAGFLCEPILSCGGQVVPPNGFFKEAYEHIRAVGGVCIADEVQVGFGRVGKHFWGFELHDVIPDIVVMGKPIGNGHPLGAVVTTEAVADAFANGMEYFNTFGGNPVSCAIGREVLRVIQDEQLQQNALEIGKYLKTGLGRLMQQFPIIGDVRGEGFFLGFELVKDRQTLEPAPEQTSYLANRMRQNGVLNSTDGLYHNVIKIKPPMCFTKDNANYLLAKFEQILKEDVMQV